MTILTLQSARVMRHKIEIHLVYGSIDLSRAIMTANPLLDHYLTDRVKSHILSLSMGRKTPREAVLNQKDRGLHRSTTVSERSQSCLLEFASPAPPAGQAA